MSWEVMSVIKAEQIAEIFEDGLNELLDYDGVSFHLWANAGEVIEPVRTGNAVYVTIDGSVRTSSSAMTANVLKMGVNTLSIEFSVPVVPPKTTASQTADDLIPVKDRQLWFVNYICAVISDYFTQYQTMTLEDDAGDSYTVGMIAGVTLPQAISLDAFMGNALPVNVYAECYIVEGGVNSRQIKIYIDGVEQPFQSVTPERDGLLSSDVHSGTTVSRSLLTSSGFVLQVTMPANTVYSFSDDAADFLFGGSPNVAHFLKISYGDTDYNYLVTITKATAGIAEVKNASFTLELTEVEDNVQLLDFPDGFEVGYFTLSSSSSSSPFTNSITGAATDTIGFSQSAPCYFYIGGKVYETTADDNELTITADETQTDYDADSGKYRLWYVASVSGSLFSFLYSNCTVL